MVHGTGTGKMNDTFSKKFKFELKNKIKKKFFFLVTTWLIWLLSMSFPK